MPGEKLPVYKLIVCGWMDYSCHSDLVAGGSIIISLEEFGDKWRFVGSPENECMLNRFVWDGLSEAKAEIERVFHIQTRIKKDGE